MKAKGWGRVINVSSIYGFTTSEHNLAYSVSKHGMRALTTTVAKEYFVHGITSNEICPGAMYSDLVERIAERNARTSGKSKKEVIQEYEEDYPGGRLVSVSSIAHAAWFLASDEASEINGVSLVVDRGLTASR
jgi:3-hydroxybutyrate dehydrogenase